MIATYNCAVCGEEIETVIDESQGLDQEYTEDCTVCAGRMYYESELI